MYSQSYLLNRALLDIRSSFIISRTFILRCWFAVGSALCILSVLWFWTATLAPLPHSPQVQAWCQLERLKSPVLHQLGYDYLTALNAKKFRTAEQVKAIANLLKQGHASAVQLYVAEKSHERLRIQAELTKRMWHNGYIALIICLFSPLCFVMGFVALRRYLRGAGYSFQGRLLFFRIATPSVFKLGALLSWGLFCFLSYSVWNPSVWEPTYPALSTTQELFSQNFPLLTQEKLWHVEFQSIQHVIKSYWMQSAIFYTFFGVILWLLGRRWAQLPCKEA